MTKVPGMCSRCLIFKENCCNMTVKIRYGRVEIMGHLLAQVQPLHTQYFLTQEEVTDSLI
jgi:hypothetical protein